jgi:polysaccharide export outer membrane protein
MKQIVITGIALLYLGWAWGGVPTNCLIESSNRSATPTTNSPMRMGSVATANAYVADDKYKLRIGDKVSFQIIEDRDAAKSLVVADSGELEVPYLGRMAALDKSCKQMASEIKALLEREYYYHASVVLALDSANRVLGHVYVWGQVRNQGPIEVIVNEDLTAGKAVLRAGGFGDFANKKRVKVIRPGGHGKEKQVFELNMVEILEDGQTEKDVVLQADDSVIVAPRLINF